MYDLSFLVKYDYKFICVKKIVCNQLFLIITHSVPYLICIIFHIYLSHIFIFEYKAVVFMKEVELSSIRED
jgi:hypothetical protein